MTVHPSWCIRPVDEATKGVHLSAPITCTGPNDAVLIAVRRFAAGPRDEWGGVFLELTEDDASQAYPLDDQVVLELRDALTHLMALDDD